jgi:hypothetical protein
VSFFFGRSGPCFWAYGTGIISDQDWEAYLAHIKTLVDDPSNVDKVRITVSYRQRAPTLAQRERLAYFVRPYLERMDGARKPFIAHAFVSDSTLTVSTLTAVTWILKRSKPFSERAFTCPRRGLEWLSGLQGEITPERCWAEMRAQVPLELFWPLENDPFIEEERSA